MLETNPKSTEPIEAKFQAMLDAAPDAMVGVNRNGNIVLANIQTEAVFGFDPADLIGRPIEILVPDRAKAIHPRHRAKYFGEPRTRPMGAGLALSARRADGTEFPAEISLSSIHTDDGVIALAAIRDITERMKTEEEIHRAREEADRANNAKSDFLSRMSHELRTPLNSILGFGQLLQMEDLKPQQHRSVERILVGGQHLLDLINEILDMARIEAGRVLMSLEPVNVALALREAVDLIRPVADQAGVRLAEPVGDLEIGVKADRQRLKQVFLNVLSNAVKFNHDGGEIRMTSSRTVDDLVKVSISDTGWGIPPDLMKDLFVPFERLGADQRGIDGTGLGLTLSKGLIENMGGTMGATSTAGAGSTFWVELPCADDIEIESPEQIVSEWGSATSATAHTVLYIEDNLANLQLIEGIFAYRPSVTLLSAMQGSLGLELAAQHVPDLILLDLHLPDIPGEEVLRRLMGDPRTKDIPVIVISADASSSTSKGLLGAGAKSFVAKPVSVSLFLAAVDEFLT